MAVLLTEPMQNPTQSVAGNGFVETCIKLLINSISQKNRKR